MLAMRVLESDKGGPQSSMLEEARQAVEALQVSIFRAFNREEDGWTNIALFSLPTTNVLSSYDFGTVPDVWGTVFLEMGHEASHLAKEPDRLLGRLRELANKEDDDEPPPSEAVIDRMSSFLREASAAMENPMPEGIASTFYGEINVTWRKGTEIVRIACFPNRPSILQSGNLSQPLGTYRSFSEPTAVDIATQLDLLTRS